MTDERSIYDEVMMMSKEILLPVNDIISNGSPESEVTIKISRMIYEMLKNSQRMFINYSRTKVRRLTGCRDRWRSDTNPVLNMTSLAP